MTDITTDLNDDIARAIDARLDDLATLDPADFELHLAAISQAEETIAHWERKQEERAEVAKPVKQRLELAKEAETKTHKAAREIGRAGRGQETDELLDARLEVQKAVRASMEMGRQFQYNSLKLESAERQLKEARAALFAAATRRIEAERERRRRVLEAARQHDEDSVLAYFHQEPEATVRAAAEASTRSALELMRHREEFARSVRAAAQPPDPFAASAASLVDLDDPPPEAA